MVVNTAQVIISTGWTNLMGYVVHGGGIRAMKIMHQQDSVNKGKASMSTIRVSELHVLTGAHVRDRWAFPFIVIDVVVVVVVVQCCFNVFLVS
eukprot:m.172850 g.172850  ORF g.172850 m.172850 type:complete len:93 (+) comp15377_c0_seq4:141-419(+)